MVLQALVGLVYDAVRQSWTVATVVLKYVLALYVARLAYEDRLNLKNFSKEVVEHSREIVTGIVVLGFVFSLLNLELTPLLKPLSEVVALAYFAFLFWRY